MFSGRHALEPQEDGSFFIDRDGTHFRHILNYLRTGAIKVKLQTDVADELAEEVRRATLRMSAMHRTMLMFMFQVMALTPPPLPACPHLYYRYACLL